MESRELSSSVIARVAYDETSNTLNVEFRNGGVYQYYEIPPDVYEELVQAESAGVYFAQNIRDVYRFARVGE